MEGQFSGEKDVTWGDVFIFLQEKKTLLMKQESTSPVSPAEIDLLIQKLKVVHKVDQFLSLLKAPISSESQSAPVQREEPGLLHVRSQSDFQST